MTLTMHGFWQAAGAMAIFLSVVGLSLLLPVVVEKFGLIPPACVVLILIFVLLWASYSSAPCMLTRTP